MFFKVFSKTKREKEYEYIISIPSIEESCRSHSHIVNLFTEFIVKHKKLLREALGISEVFSLLFYKLSVQISTFYSIEKLLNKESSCTLSLWKVGLSIQISSTKWN